MQEEQNTIVNTVASGKSLKYSTASAEAKLEVLIKWLKDNKAIDPVVLSVAEQHACTDFMLVVSAMSLRHAKSLADGLLQQCTENNFEYLRMEGYQSGQWILMDLNEIIVHIFQAEARELYRLEALWATE